MIDKFDKCLMDNYLHTDSIRCPFCGLTNSTDETTRLATVMFWSRRNGVGPQHCCHIRRKQCPIVLLIHTNSNGSAVRVEITKDES